MYLGRIVAIGMTKSGRAGAFYRVSSRSFPNRMAVLQGDKVTYKKNISISRQLRSLLQRRNPFRIVFPTSNNIVHSTDICHTVISSSGNE